MAGISYANFNTDFASTIGRVNAVSPVPNYNAMDSISQAGVGSGLFGITPDDISGRMDASYEKAVAGYDPFPGDHSKIDQLQALYGTVPEAYNVSDTVSALNKTRGTNLLTGEQAASTAAKRFQESQLPGGQSGAAAAMVRAQSLLPFLQADQTAAGEIGKYGDTAKQGALGAAANIATSLAQLEQDYTNSLANYNSQKANFGLNYAQGQSNLALQASTVNSQNQLDVLKQQAQIAENARQANLAAALQQRGQDLEAAQTATNQKITASNAYLANNKEPSGAWTTDNTGRVVSGQSSYDAYQQYKANRASVMDALAGIVH
jgi:hypothetical protein